MRCKTTTPPMRAAARLRAARRLSGPARRRGRRSTKTCRCARQPPGPASAIGWDALQIYRRLRWGRLAHIHLLDSRQYRSWQACRADASSAPAVRPPTAPSWPATAQPAGQRKSAGWTQAWPLMQRARRPRAGARDRAADAVLAAPLPIRHRAHRRLGRLPPHASACCNRWPWHTPRNTVLLGGDIHQNYVCRVHADAARADSAVLASEFCGTSISSRSGTTQAKGGRHRPPQPACAAGALRPARLRPGRHPPRAGPPRCAWWTTRCR